MPLNSKILTTQSLYCWIKDLWKYYLKFLWLHLHQAAGEERLVSFISGKLVLLTEIICIISDSEVLKFTPCIYDIC